MAVVRDTHTIRTVSSLFAINTNHVGRHIYVRAIGVSDCFLIPQETACCINSRGRSVPYNGFGSSRIGFGVLVDHAGYTYSVLTVCAPSAYDVWVNGHGLAIGIADCFIIPQIRF